MDGISVFALDAVPSRTLNTSWKTAYKDSSWFGDIYRFLDGSFSTPSAALIRKAISYQLVNSILWIHRGEFYLSSVPEGKVLDLLTEAHDKSGHWAKAGTVAHLRGKCYWPGQSSDVEKYIAGCLDCAPHGPATKSQPLNFVLVSYPFQLIGMDFIEPLPMTKAGNTYILNIACYFSRFVVPFSCETSNVEDVTRCLGLLFGTHRTPHAIYCDRGQHFDNEILRKFLRSHGVAIEYSPSGASKSTGMIEMSNRLLETVLRKDHTNSDWDERLSLSAEAVNHRIIPYLGLSPVSINFGNIYETSATTATLLHFPGQNIQKWHSDLSTPSLHCNYVRTYLTHRAEIHDLVRETTRRQREDEAARYNRGITRSVHHLGDMVMLFQKNAKKL